MAPQSGELTLKIRRIVPAAPPVVFGAFSTPDELAQWWGPEGFTAPSLRFNPSVGDSYRIQMQPPDGDPFHLTAFGTSLGTSPSAREPRSRDCAVPR